ncbi:MAG: glycosyltransferase family 4 protein [Flavobacteriales bacterium]|nr:glycosyltransferase family 4 protein [Flavobacteriales bacterium]
MKVLVISSILPIKEISHKKDENDILFVTEDEFKKEYPNVEFKYIFTFPKANKLLSYMSIKWKEYYELSKRKQTTSHGRLIHVIGLYLLPKKDIATKIFNYFNYFLQRRRIRAIISEFKPTVVHAHTVNSEAFLARKIFEEYKIPYIITVRGLSSKYSSEVFKNIKSSESVISLNSSSQKIIKNRFDKESLLIPHGVSDLFFSNRNGKIKNKTLRIITICKFLKRKNIDKVIIELAKFNNEYIFDIYGKGPEYNTLLELITKHRLQNKIFIKGYVNHYEIPNLLSNYDLFVMPSLPETFGRVYLEAMACGLPVIATKNVGIDGFIENEKEGYLVDWDREGSLYSILNKIFENPKILKTNSEYAIQLAEKFKWNKIVKKINNIYRN